MPGKDAGVVVVVTKVASVVVVGGMGRDMDISGVVVAAIVVVVVVVVVVVAIEQKSVEALSIPSCG